jgi:glutathione S-transferase
MGEQFTVADGYLFTVTGWLEDDGVDVSQFPRVREHFESVRARPAVGRALARQAAG